MKGEDQQSTVSTPLHLNERYLVKYKILHNDSTVILLWVEKGSFGGSLSLTETVCQFKKLHILLCTIPTIVMLLCPLLA